MKTNILIQLTFLGAIISFSSCSKKENQDTVNETATPIPVTVREIKATEISNNIVFSGRIEAAEKVDLSTRIMGTIEDIKVKVGDKVKKGQVLFTISIADLKAKKAQLSSKIEEVNIQLLNLEKDLKRTQNLFAKESATQKQLDDITTAYKATETNLTSLKASISEINANIDYAVVKAPFDGYVSVKTSDKGNISSPGMPVISLVSQNYKAVVSVPESQIVAIKENTLVNLTIPAINKTIEAKITQIAPSGSYNAGQFIVIVVPTSNIKELRDGLYAQVKLNDGLEKVILLNEDEIITRGQLQGVFVLGKDNEAILNWIRIGNLVNGKYQVIAGLNEGEKIIHAIDSKLTDGQKVTVK